MATTHVHSRASRSGHTFGAALLALAIVLLPLPISAGADGDALAASVLKAAFLYNFAKFTEWPALPSGAAITFCVAGDVDVATALIRTLRGQKITGHSLTVRQPPDSTTWRLCHLLFVADAESVRSAPALAGLKTLPVLTVSDSGHFAQDVGIIELYVEGERMRFAVNIDRAERAGLHLSSRLLGLAKILRDSPVL